MNAQRHHAQLAQRIVAAAVGGAWERGRHVTEHAAAKILDVSRTPARAALMVLAERGILVRAPRRGFTLDRDHVILRDVTILGEEPGDEQLRRVIIVDRLGLLIDAEMSQAALARRYNVSVPTLYRVLGRMEQEGLVERVRLRSRWRFAPTLETVGSRIASFDLRLMLEPGGLLLPGFAVVPDALGQMIREHMLLQDTPDMPRRDPVWIFELDCRFHEMLASFSGNPFLLSAIRQQNALRRLLELASYVDEQRLQAWCGEHLTILNAVQRGATMEASEQMHRHLSNAKAFAM